MTPAPNSSRSRAPRRATKVGQSVAKQILATITDEKLEPGSPLPTEAQMLEQYGVGRGTLREALRVLEVNGLITIKSGPGGGPIVQEASTHDFGRMATLFFNARGLTIGELVEARLIMEPVTARMAAERKDPACIAALRAMTFDNIEDDRVYRDETRDFHTVVMEMSGNGVISIFAEALHEVFQERVSGSLFTQGKKRRKVLETHAAIAEAIIAGDGEGAEQLMYDHMAEYVASVRKTHPLFDREVINWLA